MWKKLFSFNQVSRMLCCCFSLICLTIWKIAGGFEINITNKVEIFSCLKMSFFILIFFTYFISWYGLCFLYSSLPSKARKYIDEYILTTCDSYSSVSLYSLLVDICVSVSHFYYRAEVVYFGYNIFNTLHSVVLMFSLIYYLCVATITMGMRQKLLIASGIEIIKWLVTHEIPIFFTR